MLRYVILAIDAFYRLFTILLLWRQNCNSMPLFESVNLIMLLKYFRDDCDFVPACLNTC